MITLPYVCGAFARKKIVLRKQTGIFNLLICYLALYVVNVALALFVLDPAVMGGYLHTSRSYGDLFVIASASL